MAESSSQTLFDPVVLRLMLAVWAALGAAALDSSCQGRSLDFGHAGMAFTAWPVESGAHLASVGCIRADSAVAGDWRQIVGVSRKVAQRLVERCGFRQGGDLPSTLPLGPCAQAADFRTVRGVGGRTARRIVVAICK